MEIRYYYYFATIYNYLSCISMFVHRGIYTISTHGTKMDEFLNIGLFI